MNRIGSACVGDRRNASTEAPFSDARATLSQTQPYLNRVTRDTGMTPDQKGGHVGEQVVASSRRQMAEEWPQAVNWSVCLGYFDRCRL